MDILQGTDLAAFHAAIVSTSAVAFPGTHFEFYRADRKSLPFGSGEPGQSPRAYCLLDLTEMDDAGSDPGTDQQALVAKIDAEIIVKSLQVDARLLVRQLAGGYAAFLRRQMRWPGVLNGPIMVTGCYKDDFSPELDQYEVWRVEWAQEIWLGSGVDVYVIPAGQTESGSPALAAPPTQVLYSYVPLVGVPYKPDYTDTLSVGV